MQKIAQVIVDVPLLQTDKPYSYFVPTELSELISAGERVHVPFGKGGRLVQGIVVGLTNKIPEDVNDFKEIAELIDVEPVLSEELLALADDMRHKVFSYKISILKAMLPNLLNSKYDKILTQQDGTTERWTSLSDEQKLAAMKDFRAGKLEIRYVAESKENKKTEKYIIPDWTALEAYEPNKTAKKRIEFKEILLETDRKLAMADAVKIASRPIVNYFAEKGLLKIEEVEVSRMAKAFADVEADAAKPLNSEQQLAFDQIMTNSEEKPFLLEGVTGSGKTEIYLQVIAETLALGKTAIMLVPEISLTSQIARRFIARFGNEVALMHSGLSDGERYDEWRRIKAGGAKIVVGTRSAVFAPLDNIGVIIIDEAHDSSYKQESSPRYHARDVALWRAKYHQARLIFGSATPALETRARAQKGLYQLLRLEHRANPDAQLPTVEIVDMRHHLSDKSANFSENLLVKISEKLKKREQIVLLLNRRGYSSFVMCRDCGFVVKCPNCDVGLTLHMDTRTLNCHYCGHREAIPQVCPNCHSRNIRYFGSGTQKVEEELLQLFPEVSVIRMDVDTTSRKGAHDKLLNSFGRGEADILLGTQMIAKGLDFPDVTLVGVINGDTGLNLPDFRASERTFQLLTQVAGRSGRAEKHGDVLIQTFNPDHYAIQLAAKMDYEAFYMTEMGFRRKLAYPPYYYTVQLVISHRNEDTVIKKAYEIMTLLRENLTEKSRILGPIPRPVARTHQLYHYQILIKYRFEDRLEATLNAVLDMTQLPENHELRVIIDSDPMSFV
ncbi:MAG: primosomal protein N' [Streptococcaceae bacterium]|jgi:primosomal protein N' (replication factor Y)|nr:primosomal protein N' [Streptococcaceae bacterium]